MITTRGICVYLLKIMLARCGNQILTFIIVFAIFLYHAIYQMKC